MAFHSILFLSSEAEFKDLETILLWGHLDSAVGPKSPP